MREGRNGRRQSLEYFDLRRRIGDVVFAANDVRNRKGDVVGDGWQRVEECAVLAYQGGIGNRRRVDLDVAAQKVAPAHFRLRKLEPPMRALALGLELCAIGSRG